MSSRTDQQPAVRPLRLCLLTTFYPPFNFGGDGIDVERTARALARRGHQVTVVHDVDAFEWLAGKSLPAQPALQDGVEVIGLRSRFRVLSPLLTHQLGHPIIHAETIRRLFRDRSFDVVMYNNVSLVGGPGLLSLGGNVLKVYVAHEHWLVCPTHVLWRFNQEPCDERACVRCSLSYRRPPQVWRYTGTLGRQLSNVDVFIARSEFSRLKHRAFGFTHPMQVLPYFIPGEFSAQPPPPTEVRPHDRPYFLFVGRLTRIKGVDSLIPAFARYRDADLVIVGDGEDSAALQSKAAQLSNVRFVGRVENRKLGPYYQHAIATIVPSIGYETFGITLIESFQHGTPVIARSIGPFPEILEQSEGGLSFSTEDDLVQAIARLHQDSTLRARLGTNGYEACRERWSERVVIDDLLALVRKAMEGRRAHRPASRAPQPARG
jgi:glycosyltransferase involved in cell wall biosynthesis